VHMRCHSFPITARAVDDGKSSTDRAITVVHVSVKAVSNFALYVLPSSLTGQEPEWSKHSFITDINGQ
jgi:hypothetical protein